MPRLASVAIIIIVVRTVNITAVKKIKVHYIERNGTFNRQWELGGTNNVTAAAAAEVGRCWW